MPVHTPICASVVAAASRASPIEPPATAAKAVAVPAQAAQPTGPEMPHAAIWMILRSRGIFRIALNTEPTALNTALKKLPMALNRDLKKKPDGSV